MTKEVCALDKEQRTADVNNNDTKLGQSLIGKRLTAEQFAKKVLDYLKIKNSKKMAKLVLEEARIHMSRGLLEDILELDGSIEKLYITFEALFKSILSKEYQGFTSQVMSFGIVSDDVNSKIVTDFLNQALVSVANYIDKAHFYSDKIEQEKLLVRLRECHMRFTRAVDKLVVNKRQLMDNLDTH